ncbi:U32 family peptidase [Paenibacillus tritici]|uniref:U32 family peptidase n=1 Tax=Paenibacillus tritici TaxID=1873425 RepID=A0ABX2DUD4_9BACL|nr:U32 family peptidase [Paenibacillus tritici]NQX47747.1 U32 family peptidase [Paenibacillus tritici]QUL52235.1 U32 family peptidase [Paenibacillus tritici]
MEYYSVPSDFKMETIDRYAQMNEEYAHAKVLETYGNITVNNELASGRAVSQLPRIDLLDLRRYIEYSNAKNIDFNYTINAIYLNNKEFTREGVQEIRSFLADLYQAGVRSITAALPSLVEIIKSSGYDFAVKSSTLCQITNANKASFYRDMGVDRIVVDESINRNFGSLREIVKTFGDKVEVIINPICLKDCVYRMFHYNQIGGDSTGSASEISVNYYEHRCVLQRYRDIGNLLKISWVRPEDIPYYTSVGIHYFKLQGRHLVMKGDPVRTLKCYFDRSYDGDLMDIINMFHSINHFKILLDNKKLEGFIKPFYEKDHFCQKSCESCSYCTNYSKKIIDYDKATEVVQMAQTFYHEYDKFNGLIESCSSEEEEMKRTVEVDFDL